MGSPILTVGHVYQAVKTDDPDKRRKVAALETPSKAYGRRIKRLLTWI